MSEPDYYYTIEDTATAEIKIKGSKFIGYAAPATDKDSAVAYLDAIRSKHFDATHNCFAYQIGCDGNDFRSSDDGEPSGTAGKPILLAIKKYEVSDIIVVVTRYFGGTKLGVGGLIRAYSDAAEEVLKLCVKKIVHRTNAIHITCRYEEVSFIKRMLSQTAISFTEDYTDKVEFIANIPLSKTQSFIEQIVSGTNTLATAAMLESN
ncbi:MAG: YigZ family protein [Ignavibacteria bacterium]|jgi:uncharacterized YigZ family protein|nr:YigZ family protein [Ignavibacteria bacterium]